MSMCILLAAIQQPECKECKTRIHSNHMSNLLNHTHIRRESHGGICHIRTWYAICNQCFVYFENGENKVRWKLVKQPHPWFTSLWSGATTIPPKEVTIKNKTKRTCYPGNHHWDCHHGTPSISEIGAIQLNNNYMTGYQFKAPPVVTRWHVQ